MSDISWGSSDLTITVFTWPNWCPPMYFRVTPGGHASAPKSPQRQQNSSSTTNPENSRLSCAPRAKVHRTCVLYSPGLCEGRVWRNRFSFTNCHVFNKGHGRRVGDGTFKVVICTNSSLKVPGSKTKVWFLFNANNNIQRPAQVRSGKVAWNNLSTFVSIQSLVSTRLEKNVIN